MQLISYTEAREKRLAHYFNGKPCKYGHISERKTASGNCIECLKTVHRDAHKRNRRENARKISKRKKDHERRGPGRPKHLARLKVRSALKFGRLVKRPCERCGAADLVHAHHDDYEKPLDVMWLCPLHHRQRHKELGSITTKIEDA
jgi:hypothetical protein